MLSKYASEIIKILVHQDDKFITNAQIAKMLNVSERSVSSYMNEVAQYCEERNYHLIRKRGKGICLRLGVHKEELEQEFPEKNLCIKTREYRISYIIRTLIESKEPYTAALFADELFVSKATIRTDIEKANQSLEADHIKIYQTTGKGIEIKVEDKIPEINVTSVLPANSAHLIDEDQYDLVITTISKLKISHPYVAYTTPIVSQQDVYRIQKKCHQMKETKKNHNQEYTISSLIKKEFILVEKEVMSKEEILKKGCDLLYKNDYVKQGFYEDVLKREEISASVLGGGVALPHGMANLVIKPAVVIMKCAQRTEWQDGCVDIVFLLALNFEDIQSTRAFFSSFYEMTMEKNTTFLIRKAETEEEIMDVIMNSMNETEE